jgi:lipoprotein-anchoring transpeptidase ErfK/SrfK
LSTILRTLACLPLLGLVGCPSASPEQAGGVPSAQASAGVSGVPNPVSSMVVDHGEFDTKTPTGSSELGATTIASTVYKLPNSNSRRLGYVRLGGRIPRDTEVVSAASGREQWYRVYPTGYASTEEFTADLSNPLVRAASVRPALDHPLPYRYGFIRATAPQYLRVPSRLEQEKSEFQLAEHLAWYAEHEKEVQQVVVGANDIPLDPRGIAVPGLKPAPSFVPTSALALGQLLGGETPDDPVPFWLAEGKRLIPNVSAFQVPEYAVFADRVRRKTGVSLVGSFLSVDGEQKRRFAIAVDLRLIPATKIKPDTGSAFHGVEVGGSVAMPFAWIITDQARTYQLVRDRDEARSGDVLPKRVIVPLSGKARIKAGKRFYQTAKDETVWLRADEISIASPPPALPQAAERGEKWIDISLRQQVLVLYEGKRPTYATLVSTGRDRLGDPKTTLSTPQGEFRIRSKHIAAAMDSEENSSVSGGSRENTGKVQGTDPEERAATTARLLDAERTGKKLSREDQQRLANVKKGRDPEYGVTRRRGSLGFELRDVPWIQYFASGYALHGAYWHDVFGIPRSHGCVNLAPIDARYVFFWTDPPVPTGWHGINVGTEMGEGTPVVIRE